MELTKTNIINFFEAKLEKNEIPKSDENWLVGLIDDFSLDSINQFGKAIIHNGNVYIAYSFTILDSFLCTLLSERIKNSLGKVLISNTKSLNICNNFGGGHVYSKKFDALVYTEKNNGFVAVKCAFSNESLDLLIEECVVYLNEFTNISYSIGFKVDYDPQNFKLHLFVFERVKEPNEEKIKQLDSLMKSGEFKIQNFRSVDLEDFQNAYYKDEMHKFDVKVTFKKEIDLKNINEGIRFVLDKQKITNEIENAEVFISPDDLNNIFYLWKKKFHIKEQ